jgi:hypothetical protein
MHSPTNLGDDGQYGVNIGRCSVEIQMHARNG